ncbi:SCO family protein [Alginatibacterium sediminis]|uniref:SCO family protein n=1 Tax=Alginatibacterium sediminis TaxID=2164068 RepID=A0A420EJM7_9ALTE|nr:SCO family protein [Alginatibacterium sediminis]RKF20877.1 SCO family protein [Alginatibacterium sediminis]
MNKSNLLSIVVLASSFAAGLWFFNSNQAEQTAPIASPAATRIPTELFNMESADGRFQGFVSKPQLYVSYFGFTHCPDVCPTSLAMLAGALQQLNDEQRAQLTPLFISLDPERDDAKKTNDYAAFFDAQIVGLSPHPGQLKGLAQLLGVYYKYVEIEGSEINYSVDHNSFFYLLNQDGDLLEKVPHTLSPTPLLEAIVRHLPKD